MQFLLVKGSLIKLLRLLSRSYLHSSIYCLYYCYHTHHPRVIFTLAILVSSNYHLRIILASSIVYNIILGICELSSLTLCNAEAAYLLALHESLCNTKRFSCLSNMFSLYLNTFLCSRLYLLLIEVPCVKKLKKYLNTKNTYFCTYV